MKRYQLYLNPHSISVLDEVGTDIGLSRSHLIRLAIETLVDNLTKVFIATKTPPKDKHILDSLIGSIKIKGSKKTNFAQNIDDIYFHD